MRYISAADVYSINEEVLGHEPVIRDRRLLQAACQRPFQRAFGQDAYPTLFEKAASLLHALAHDHLFVDGNKRTATRATVTFLQENGYNVTWSDEAIAAFVLRIARGDADIPEIAAWLEAHSEPHA